MSTTRRTFVASGTLMAAAALTAGPAWTQALPFVSESDPPAAALAFHSEASTIDKQKFPQYAVGQSCSACAFYEGKPETTDGTCQMYSGKRVQSNAWCAAFFKRP
jgi:hypothetical protein